MVEDEVMAGNVVLPVGWGVTRTTLDASKGVSIGRWLRIQVVRYWMLTAIVNAAVDKEGIGRCAPRFH